MTTLTTQFAATFKNDQLLEDLKDGEFNGVREFEYQFREHDHEIHGSVCRVYLYEGNQFFTSYLYAESDDAREDFAEVEKIYGISFKPMHSRVISRLSRAFFKQ